jgi:hypothetical protein
MFTANGWKRARYCSPDGDNCVEVNLSHPGLSAVRDSKRADGTILIFNAAGWADFLRFVQGD